MLDTVVPQSLVYQLITSLASTIETKWSKISTCAIPRTLVQLVYTNIAPTLPRPVVGPYPYNADERSSPARSEAECEQWLENCVEASEDGWLHQARITQMCVIFAPFRCNGLIARRGEEENPFGTSKVEAAKSFEGKAWPLVVLLGMGLFLMTALHRMVPRGPIRAASAGRPLLDNSTLSNKADLRPMSPPVLASRSATQSSVLSATSPPLGVSLELGEDEVLLGSTAKWSFGDLVSGNGKTVAEKIASGSFGEFMEC